MTKPSEPVYFSDQNWPSLYHYEEAIKDYTMRLQAYYTACYINGIDPE